MATPATVRGVFLVAGVSRNKRLYTAEAIGKAVRRMQAKIAAGRPVPMHTSHQAHAEGDTRAIAGHIVAVTQDKDGRAKFVGKLVDTAAGRDIAALVTPDADGHRALKSVSIFGRWRGPTRTVNGAETADDLDIEGVDFAAHPGVKDAELEAAGKRAGLIVESYKTSEVFSDMITKHKKKGKKAQERARIDTLLEGDPLVSAVVEAISDGADASNLSDAAVLEAYVELSRRAHETAGGRTFLGTATGPSPFASGGLSPTERRLVGRVLAESDQLTEKNLSEMSVDQLVALLVG